MSKTVLITGATGFIGSNLLKRCKEKGWAVRAFVLPNDPEEATVQALGATVVYGDITDEAAVLVAAEGVNIIFHCAGLVTDWAPKSLFQGVMVSGTENVCKAAKAHMVDRLVDISTNDVFGMIEGVEMDESFPLKKWGEPYPDYKIEAEKIVWQYHKEHNVPATMVYPCWVYGIGDKTFVPLLADAIVKKEMVYWRKDVIVWPTYIDNVVDLLLLIAEDDKAIGKGFLVHDGESTTLQQFCTEIATAMDVTPPKLHIPYSIAYLAALLMELVWGVFKLKSRPLLTTYAVKNLGSRFKFSIQRAADEVGWKPRVSHKEGMDLTLKWLKTLDINKLKEK